jgi:hypothetical protein
LLLIFWDSRPPFLVVRSDWLASWGTVSLLVVDWLGVELAFSGWVWPSNSNLEGLVSELAESFLRGAQV